MGIAADEAWVFLALGAAVIDALRVKEHQNKRHSYIPAVSGLVKVVSSAVVIHVNVDFVDTG